MEQTVGINILQCDDRLKTVYSEFRTKKKKAGPLRDTWMDSLAAAQALVGNSTQEKKLRSLRLQEHQRSMGRNVKYARGKLKSGGLTMVLTPGDTAEEWTECTTKDAIEIACLQENERRFTQATDTPFYQPTVVDTVGWLGLGPGADHILAGTYEAPHDLDAQAQQFIPYLHTPPSILNAPPTSTVITTEEWIQAWQHTKERTASVPSPLSYATFKAGIQSPTISDFEATMANIPWATGFSPERWQTGTNIMLEKRRATFR